METKVNKEEQNELKQNRERGASLVEYGLLVALIVGVAIVGITSLGTSINTKFNGIAGQVDSAGN